MRRRQCKACGHEFPASGEQHLCPECRSAARRATVTLIRVCVTCGRVFEGGPRARYCLECRAERAAKMKAEGRRRAAEGKTRKLGSTDYCVICGGEYIVNSGLQRYCPDCAAEAVRQQVLPRKRERAAKHREKTAARKQDLKVAGQICAYCGKPYTPTGPSVTCSPECERAYRSLKWGEADYKRGKRKTPPKKENAK